MLYRYLCFLIFFGGTLGTFAQGETSNWYFGNGAGIRFNNDGSVVPLNDGRLSTFEGCTSISDAIGNLLLYTDGITVYDRNHNIMQNGNGLHGDPSSTQSAIVVQKPQDPNILYIFTVDTSTFEEDPDRGLNYSEVDMTLNGGLGGITRKNINLMPDCSEKISAVVKNCQDESIWVVTLGTENGEIAPYNTYHAFEVSATGVNPTAVKSKFDDLEVVDPRGYLKFSSDGSKLASANSSSGLFLYDFDATTGMVSNQDSIAVSAPNKFPYGIEFAPNQRFLYVHTSNNAPAPEEGVHSSSLLQYDLTAPNIEASEIEIDRRPIYRGALQLGQNGKIYRTIAENYLKGTSYLGVIDNPNALGDAADYRHNAVFLGADQSTQGLPPFIQSFFDRVAIIKNADGTTSTSETICFGEDFALEADLVPNATYIWEKDGSPLPNSGNTLTVRGADLPDSGRYSLEIIPSDPSECPIIGEAFILVNPLPDNPPLFLAQCEIVLNATPDGLTSFNLEQAIFNPDYSYTFYETLSDLSADIPIPNAIGYENTTAYNQTIYYKAIDSEGCENTGTLDLEVRSIVINSGDEQVFYTCDEDSSDGFLEGFFDLNAVQNQEYPSSNVVFYANQEDASLEQNPISGNYFTGSTQIFARIETGNECQDIDLISLVVNPTPAFEFETRLTWCTDGPPLTVQAPGGFDLYQWYRVEGANLTDIGNQQEIQVSGLGLFILEVGYQYITPEGIFECFDSKEFEVIPSNIASIQHVDVTDLTNNNLVEVFVTGDGDYEYSLDGVNYQDAPLFENVEPGFATLQVRDKNGCGIAEQLVSVIGYPKFFTPNGDNVNDTWQIIGINTEYQAESLISIYDRYGKLMAMVSPKTEGWNGTFNNNDLPSSDYWFKLNLEDGRIFKGHFTLKR